ncbi:MAG: 3-isopropylmalate dehydratase small subunit [Prevotella sp.]|nr:3-isopropylmalate dehydratase small subunit [Prevotella sp.]
MAKEKFNIVQSTCIPIEIDNCNTDLIIPARYLASTTRDPQFFADAFMHDLRYDSKGELVKDFVLNRPEYSEKPSKGIHQIIVGAQNWGSGSSREHAAWAIAGYGVRVVIATSFADIHKNNLLNCFVLPVMVPEAFQKELVESIKADPQTLVKVDLGKQTVTNMATGNSVSFEINSYKKYCLLNAYDDIDFLLASKDKIVNFEKSRKR